MKNYTDRERGAGVGLNGLSSSYSFAALNCIRGSPCLSSLYQFSVFLESFSREPSFGLDFLVNDTSWKEEGLNGTVWSHDALDVI